MLVDSEGTMLVDSEGNTVNQYKGLKISYVVEGLFFQMILLKKVDCTRQLRDEGTEPYFQARSENCPDRYSFRNS